MAIIFLKDQVKESPVPKEPVKPVKSFSELLREAKGVTDPVEPVANPRPEVVEVPAVVISQGEHSRPRPVETTPVEQPIVEQAPQYDNHHVLIVNGQPKKVGKKSQYLLDMLTIET
jgi:hypothetical protein